MVRRLRRRGGRRGNRSRRRGVRTVGPGGLVLFLLCALAVCALAWWLYSAGLPWGPRRAPPGPETRSSTPAPSLPAPRPETVEVYPTEPEAPQTGLPATPAPPPRPAPPRGAYLSVVVDDLGRSVADVERLAALGVPLSYAVLPFESRTGEVVAALGRREAEILLHLPMEGRNGADPGPGALTLGMAGGRLTAATRSALEAVPGAVGVNNHMGSVLTADAPSMRRVLTELGARNLFFLDSRTTAQSVAYRAALELGLPAAERDVFLDPDLEPEAIRLQFHRLLDVARREGSAVAIGHPHPATLRVLAEEIPRALDLGYEFVPVSLLLDRSPTPL